MASLDLALKLTDCPVCRDTYVEPKILPCAHLLCRDCLVSLIKMNANAQCPLCHSALEDTHDSTVHKSDDLVDSLPTDEVMRAISESVRLLGQSRMCYVHTTVEASSVCLQCGTMLCHTCKVVHAKMPLTSLHDVEDINNVTSASLFASKQVSCFDHPDRPSELFCSTHEIYVCHLCAFANHRACAEVAHFSEFLDKYKRYLSEMEVKLSEAESTLNAAISKIENHVVNSGKNLKTCFVEIDANCDRLQGLVESCRKRLKKWAQEVDDSTKTAANKKKTFLNQKRGRVTSHKFLINRMQDVAPGAQLLAIAPRLLRQINDLDISPTLPSTMTSLTRMMVTISGISVLRVERELARMGEMVVTPSSIKIQNSWCFHRNHGTSIELTCNGMTAVLGSIGNGIVMSREPMRVNLLYEVRVDEINLHSSGGSMITGVVTENPSILQLPIFASCIQSALGVYSGHVCVNKKWTESKYGQALNKVKVGSRVGTLIDDTRCVHLYVDGKDQGVVFRGVKQPCYVLIDLVYYLKKVTTLPLRSVK